MSILGSIFKNNNREIDKMDKPETANDSVPFEGCYENGIIKVCSGKYSKSYYLPEVNFVTAAEDKQWEIATGFSEFISSFDPTVTIFVTLYNKTQNKSKLQEMLFVEPLNDKLTKYRTEYNNKVIARMLDEANNNLKAVPILTITVEAIDVFEAESIFSNKLDISVRNYSAALSEKKCEPLTIEERLDILNSIYHMDNYMPLTERREYKGKEIVAFSLENCKAQGIRAKDCIAPIMMDIQDKKIVFNDEYVSKTFFITNYPSYLRGDILTDICNIPTNSLVTTVYKIKDTMEGINNVREKGTNVRGKLMDKQKIASRKGYDSSLVSPDLQDTDIETKELLQELTKEDKKAIMLTFIITIFANSEEEMLSYESQLKLSASKHLVTIQPMVGQQEIGFNTSLPIGCFQVPYERFVTTSTLDSLSPYRAKNIFYDHGKYYGLNGISGNVIVYDRLAGLNPNCCILGMPGAGKSFASKREIINTLLGSPNDEVYIIDPEGEYTALAKALGGSIIKISLNSKYRINPLDIRLDSSDEDAPDPLKAKQDFVTTLIDIMIGGKYGLSPVEISIIERCTSTIYEEHIKYLYENNLDYDYEKAPTLKELQNELKNQPQVEANQMAISLERFSHGAADAFAYRTNLDVTNRFTVYDIRDIGANLKEAGEYICLDNLFNKMIENKKKGIRTWLYIDEFYLLMQKPSSAAYVSEIWKRARKWDGCPCAITQNVEDMLKSEDARTVINNCSLVILMGQAPINKQQLAKIYGLSPEEQKYISTPKPGTGLIVINNTTIVPMVDEFPNDTELYKLMTTKPDERIL